MEIQDLKKKIKTLSSLKVAAKKSTFLKGYESIFLNYGAMCEFMYDNFSEFEVLDIEMFAHFGDAIASVYNRLKANEKINERELNLLNVLIGQYSDMLTSLYGYVSPLKEKITKDNLKERITVRLHELKNELDYLDCLYFLYRPIELNKIEGVATIEVCDEVIKYIKEYMHAVDVKKNELSSPLLEPIFDGLNRVEELIIRLRVVINPVSKNTKEVALAGLQDFLTEANIVKAQK